jgi:LEA14-like dessication related protein
MPMEDLMARFRRWLGVLVLVVAGAAGGCTVLTPHFEKPSLTVAGVDIEHADAREQRFRVRVLVTNPNSYALPIRGLTFTMDLAGERAGSGASAAPFTVPARGSSEFDAIVTTDLATAMLKILPRLWRAGSDPLEYHLVGTISSDLPLLHSVPFDQRGTFDLGHHAP